MNYLPPKIEFYRKRNFSEKLNVTFQFIRENVKPLVKFTVYLLLPICLIQSYAVNSFIGFALDMSRLNSPESFTGSILRNYGVLVLCLMVGSILISSLIYTLMQAYEKRESRLAGIQWSDFSEQLIFNIKRSLKFVGIAIAFAVLFVIVLSLFFALLASLSSGFLVFCVFLVIIAILVFMVPLSLLLPVYMLEPETNLQQAVIKAWKFGFSDFWSLLGFLIVISIISNILQTITMMPWYITFLVGAIFSTTSDPTITHSIVYKLVTYLFGIIQNLGAYVATVIMIIGLAFQYFHSREKHEGVTIESNITNFSDLQ